MSAATPSYTLVTPAPRTVPAAAGLFRNTCWVTKPVNKWTGWSARSRASSHARPILLSAHTLFPCASSHGSCSQQRGALGSRNTLAPKSSCYCLSRLANWHPSKVKSNFYEQGIFGNFLSTILHPQQASAPCHINLPAAVNPTAGPTLIVTESS